MKLLKTIAKILAILLKISVLIALVNMLFSFIEKLVHRKMPEGGRFYVWKHGSIFYHVKGTGSPVLLVHGFDPEHSGKDLETLSNHLAAGHTVYRIDLLGFGLSDKPWFTYTNYLYVQLILNFIENVIGETTDVVACGGSCLSALQANKLDPSMIGKVVLIDPLYEEPLPYKGNFSNTIRKILDFPVIGCFLYNLYGLTRKAPLDKEGRHVLTSRLAGYLTSSLSGHEDLITENAAVMSRAVNVEETLDFEEMDSSLI